MFEFLLILGVVFLAFALRTASQPWLRKIGALAILAASFMVGYFLSNGRIWVGALTAIAWFFIPWFEILFRIRKLRLPLDKKIRHKTPPSRERFPDLPEVTEEVEEEGFEYIDDAGWEWNDTTQFFRLFYHPKSKTEVAVCLSEQGPVAFTYVSLSSRTRDGRILRTWNYPFSYTMELSPDLKMNRAPAADSFRDLLTHHTDFLSEERVSATELSEENTDEIHDQLQREIERQINYNLDRGIIALSGEGTFKYSWRGLFFLWRQFVKDMIKLS
ncbi:MAG: hypothetical protein AAGD22_13570 [Verrucomicrobiota bacterium]